MADKDFSALIRAELDKTRLRQDIPKIQDEIDKRKFKAHIEKFTLNTKDLPSQIQGSLDSHKFTIYLDGIKMSNIDSEAAAAGKKYSASFSKAFRNLEKDTFTVASTTVDPLFSKLKKMSADKGLGMTKIISSLESKVRSTSFSDTGIKESDILDEIKQLNTLKKEILEGNLSDGDKLAKWKEFEQIVQRTTNKLDIAKNSAQGYVNSLKVTQLNTKVETWLKKNTKAADAFEKEVKELKDALDALNKSESNGNYSKDLYNNVLNLQAKLDAKAKSSGKMGLKFTDQLGNAFKKFSGYFTVYDAFNKARQMLQAMYQNVLAVDTAMTNLYKVTDETNARYDTFLKNATKTAQELGRTVSGYVTQASEWAKLGYSLSESEELAKVSSIYANVGDIDDAQAVSDMVTALKAFRIESSDAIKVVDQLNELGELYCPYRILRLASSYIG